MRKLCFILFFCIMSLLGGHCVAQNVFLNKNVNTDTIVVGQPFDYQLYMTVPKDYYVEWKQFGDTLSKSIDVIEAGDVVTTPINNSDNVKMTQNLKLTSFDTGYVYVPSIEIVYSTSIKDSIRRKLYTGEYELYVTTVAVDTTEAFRPIKDVLRQGATAKEVLFVVVVVLIIAGAVYLFIYLKKHKKDPETVVVEKKKPTIPAIVTARAKLAEIKDSEAWKSLNTKDYYTNLTDIAREYLEGQFGIEAVEMTTDEILQAVRTLNINEIAKDKLQETLILADFVKFAKANPTAEQNEESFKETNYFVEDSYAYCQEVEKKKKEEEAK
ncbi:MAG: hypothetical protein IJT45_02815 [Bacteroidales bacterium]|nr:hypothetical protein [Bacteroidales bacterium]